MMHIVFLKSIRTAKKSAIVEPVDANRDEDQDGEQPDDGGEDQDEEQDENQEGDENDADGVDDDLGADVGAEEQDGVPSGFGQHNVEEGHHVAFQAGSFGGSGRVSSSGEDGCTVSDKTGREHRVHWSEITGHSPSA